MQFAYAALFILAAGIVFTALSVIPIPAGIIAAGPSLIVAILLEGFLFRHLLRDR